MADADQQAADQQAAGLIHPSFFLLPHLLPLYLIPPLFSSSSPSSMVKKMWGCGGRLGGSIGLIAVGGLEPL